MLLHRNAGKVGHLLPKPGEPVEECGLPRIGWTDDRDYRVRRTFGWRRQYRGSAAAPVAVTHASVLRARNISLDAVSRRNANSDPSTRYTRGSPPGAERAATT